MKRSDLAGLSADSRAEALRQLADGGKPKPSSGLPTSRMNKGESLYSAFLFRRMKAGEVRSFQFEGDTFLLAHLCRYTPDFRVILADSTVEYHECKGKKGKSYYAHEDARIKIKVAATLYPQFTFCVVWLDNGTWKRKDVPRVKLPHKETDNG